MVTAPRFGEKYPFSPSDVMIKAASLRGIIQGSSVPGAFLPRLIELQQQGQFPVERLVRTYDFADINQAFADSHDGTAVKPVLKMT
jgi:aryl-alcohol dehydrogenase